MEPRRRSQLSIRKVPARVELTSLLTSPLLNSSLAFLLALSLGSGLGLGCAQPGADEVSLCAEAPSAEVMAAASAWAAADPGIEATRSETADPARGAEVFEQQCARCHAPKLVDRGSRFFHGYPRLDCAPYLERVSDAYLYRVISEGGGAVGRDPAMKPFAELLSDAERGDLVAYLRGLTPSPAAR